MKRFALAGTVALMMTGALWFASDIRPCSGAEPAKPDKIRRFLYVTVPDGAGGSKGHRGILVFDIDNGHKYVRKIDLPTVKSTRGVCASAVTDRLYISHSNGIILCLDLKTDKIVWQKAFVKEGGGCDRIVMTPDGKKIYIPSGYWSNDEHLKVVDGANGKFLKRIQIAPKGGCHDALCSVDGKRVYCGSTRSNTLTVVDTETDTVIKRIGPFKGVIFPFTVNSAQTLCYVNTSRKLVGFEIGDIKTGKKLHQIKVKGKENQKRRCHGIGMTPDEKEIWLVDQTVKKMYVFDATVMPPKEKETIEMSLKAHGWITFSIDGVYAYPDTGDIIDAKTKKIIATLKDAKGKRVVSSKFIEVQFKGDDAVKIGHQLGVGRLNSADATAGKAAGTKRK